LRPLSAQPRKQCDSSELWISTKCGELDPTSHCGANAGAGNLGDRLIPVGIHAGFGETAALTGADPLCRDRAWRFARSG